ACSGACIPTGCDTLRRFESGWGRRLTVSFAPTAVRRVLQRFARASHERAVRRQSVRRPRDAQSFRSPNAFGCRTPPASAGVTRAGDARNRAQIFIDGPEIAIGHLRVSRPRHDLEQRTLEWRGKIRMQQIRIESRPNRVLEL